MAEMIDHTTLTQLVEAGAISGASIVGQTGGWAVLVKFGVCERSLSAQRSRKIRLFRKFETLVCYLKEIGIAHFDVDATSYDSGTLVTARRPDRALALKRAHEAAAYDTWLRNQVQASIDDPRPSVSDEVARVLFSKRKDVLRKSVT